MIESALCWLICVTIQIKTVPKIEVYETKQVQEIQQSMGGSAETGVDRRNSNKLGGQNSNGTQPNNGQTNPKVDKTAIIANSTNDKQAIIAKIQETFKEDADEAIKIFTCESGLRSNAIGHNTNGSSDHGVAQINSVHFSKVPSKDKVAWLLNPDNNIALAYQIYQRQGWNPWVCKKVLAMK